jgi:hypothetical protein
MTQWARNDPLRHCEAQPLAARSNATWRAVAIYAFVRRLSWIASFLAMTEQGRNDAVGAQ